MLAVARSPPMTRKWSARSQQGKEYVIFTIMSSHFILKSDQQKYPTKCPSYSFCNEKFPANPSDKVKNLYKQYLNLRHDPTLERYATGEQRGIQVHLALLCTAITMDHKWSTGKGNPKWPTDIDFSGLHARVLGLNTTGQVWSLLANDIVLHAAAAWQSFLDKIAHHMTNKRVNGKTVTMGLTFLQWSNMAAIQKFNVTGDGSAG